MLVTKASTEEICGVGGTVSFWSEFEIPIERILGWKHNSHIYLIYFREEGMRGRER